MAVALSAGLLGATACGGAPREPVARVAVATPEVTLRYPGTVAVDATFTPTVALADPVVFVHLLDRDGRLLRTFDHAFPASWLVGEEVSYGIELWQSVLAPPLPVGNYELTLGVTAGGERPPLEILGEEIGDGEYVVARVTVPPPAAAAPRLELGVGWLPPGADTDRQVLGGRWLEKRGHLALRELSGRLDVALTLLIPDPEAVPHMLVLDEGVESPRVRVSSPCAPVTRTVEGFGAHRVVMPLTPGDGGECSLELSADFAFVDPASLGRLAVLLQRVEWSPGAADPEVTVDAPPGADPAAGR